MQNFEYICTVGEGAYGEVWKCLDRTTGKTVAVKGFKQAHEDKLVMRLAVREARVLGAINHPSLVRMLGAFQSRSGRVYLVFEFVGPSVHDILELSPSGLPSMKVKALAWQLICAMTYLHERKIVHRDIKPANILMDEQGIMKLCDFGFARITRCGPREVQKCTSYIVTRWYRAPEVLVGGLYGACADIWSIGCTLAEIATGRPLFPGNSTSDQLWRIMRCLGLLPKNLNLCLAADPHLAPLSTSPPPLHRTLRQRLPDIEPRLLHLIEACVQLDPAQRPTARDLLQMPYFWDLTKCVSGLQLTACLAAEAAAAVGPAVKPQLTLRGSTQGLINRSPPPPSTAGVEGQHVQQHTPPQSLGSSRRGPAPATPHQAPAVGQVPLKSKLRKFTPSQAQTPIRSLPKEVTEPLEPVSSHSPGQPHVVLQLTQDGGVNESAGPAATVPPTQKQKHQQQQQKMLQMPQLSSASTQQRSPRPQLILSQRDGRSKQEGGPTAHPLEASSSTTTPASLSPEPPQRQAHLQQHPESAEHQQLHRQEVAEVVSNNAMETPKTPDTPKTMTEPKTVVAGPETTTLKEHRNALATPKLLEAPERVVAVPELLEAPKTPQPSPSERPSQAIGLLGPSMTPQAVSPTSVLMDGGCNSQPSTFDGANRSSGAEPRVLPAGGRPLTSPDQMDANAAATAAAATAATDTDAATATDTAADTCTSSAGPAAATVFGGVTTISTTATATPHSTHQLESTPGPLVQQQRPAHQRYEIPKGRQMVTGRTPQHVTPAAGINSAVRSLVGAGILSSSCPLQILPRAERRPSGGIGGVVGSRRHTFGLLTHMQPPFPVAAAAAAATVRRHTLGIPRVVESWAPAAAGAQSTTAACRAVLAAVNIHSCSTTATYHYANTCTSNRLSPARASVRNVCSTTGLYDGCVATPASTTGYMTSSLTHLGDVGSLPRGLTMARSSPLCTAGLMTSSSRPMGFGSATTGLPSGSSWDEISTPIGAPPLRQHPVAGGPTLPHVQPTATCPTACISASGMSSCRTTNGMRAVPETPTPPTPAPSQLSSGVTRRCSSRMGASSLQHAPSFATGSCGMRSFPTLAEVEERPSEGSLSLKRSNTDALGFKRSSSAVRRGNAGGVVRLRRTLRNTAALLLGLLVRGGASGSTAVSLAAKVASAPAAGGCVHYQAVLTCGPLSQQSQWHPQQQQQQHQHQYQQHQIQQQQQLQQQHQGPNWRQPGPVPTSTCSNSSSAGEPTGHIGSSRELNRSTSTTLYAAPLEFDREPSIQNPNAMQVVRTEGSLYGCGRNAVVSRTSMMGSNNDTGSGNSPKQLATCGTVVVITAGIAMEGVGSSASGSTTVQATVKATVKATATPGGTAAHVDVQLLQHRPSASQLTSSSSRRSLHHALAAAGTDRPPSVAISAVTINAMTLNEKALHPHQQQSHHDLLHQQQQMPDSVPSGAGKLLLGTSVRTLTARPLAYDNGDVSPATILNTTDLHDVDEEFEDTAGGCGCWVGVGRRRRNEGEKRNRGVFARLMGALRRAVGGEREAPKGRGGLHKKTSSRDPAAEVYG